MIRKIARPMIASVYIADGADSLLNTSEHTEAAETLIKRARAILPREYARRVPRDPELVVRAVGGTKVAAGGALAVGFLPRVSATVLAATAIPTMISRHAFWETQDKAERSARRSGFLTNLALLGGLFITSADTAGKPGLKWRANKAAEVTSKKVHKALPTKSETEKFDSARDWFDEATDKVTEYAHRAQDYYEDNKDDWKGLATAHRRSRHHRDRSRRPQGVRLLPGQQGRLAGRRPGQPRLPVRASSRPPPPPRSDADEALVAAEKKSGRAAAGPQERQAAVPRGQGHRQGPEARRLGRPLTCPRPLRVGAVDSAILDGPFFQEVSSQVSSNNEIAHEQDYVDDLFARLDAEVAAANERLRRVQLEVDPANPDADALIRRETEYHGLNARLDRLNLAQLGLVFGRIDIDDPATEPENPVPGEPQLDRRYIGRMGLDVREEGYRTLLLDWRVPMARPFYLATTAQPEGVHLRRHIRTKGREVTGIDDEWLSGPGAGEGREGVGSESALFQAMQAARTGHMRSIVETIQREQDLIIRDDTRGVMVVEGGPGTGKTAVALHRVAYLLYTAREQLSKTGVLIIGPNSTFLEYISASSGSVRRASCCRPSATFTPACPAPPRITPDQGD